MKRTFLLLLLSGWSCLLWATPNVWLPGPAQSGPMGDGALQELGAVRPLIWRAPADPPEKNYQLQLQLPEMGAVQLQVSHRQQHANGDITVFGRLQGGATGTASITYGQHGMLGTIKGAGYNYSLRAEGQHGVVTNLLHPGAQLQQMDLGGTGERLSPAKYQGRVKDTEQSLRSVSGQSHQVIDVMFLYTAGMQAKYPGGLVETRLNHLIAITNQAYADSAIPLALRLVHSQQVAYSDNTDNSNAVQDLQDTMRGFSRPGLAGIAALRQQMGADIVTLFRPHDIDIRGSCGVARFPVDQSTGVNVVSDGSSGFSICDDYTYAHEVGHNLDAEHQVGGPTRTDLGPAHALVIPGRFNTIMTSFGTGRQDRFLGLPVFSNRNLRCGGMPCGSLTANNALRISERISFVAAYMPSVSSAPFPPEPTPMVFDSDQDGVDDREDAFPLDERYVADTDGDGLADLLDDFPANASFKYDTDGDGIANSIDQDDDNDGVIDTLDALPLDAAESADSDDDGVGDNADRFPLDDLVSRDTDLDGIGDNLDNDDDADGYADLRLPQTLDDYDLLVVSAGTNRVLRYDGGSGVYAGVAVPEQGIRAAVTHQSDIALGRNGLLYVVYKSGIRRFDLATGQEVDLLVDGFFNGLPVAVLNSGFPVSLTLTDADDLLVSTRFDGSLRRFRAISGRPVGGGYFISADAAPLVALTTAPDGRVYGVGLDGRVVRFEDSAGLSSTQLVFPQSSILAQPSDIAVAADGRVFIADSAANRVYVSDQNGFNLRVLINGQGLQAPSGLTLGPDGQLYVASSGSNQILRYDSQTGAALGAFTRGPAGRLQNPQDILFVPKVEDRFPLDPENSLFPRPGLWGNLAIPGRGIDLALIEDRIAVVWYTYRDDGTPDWYIATGNFSGREWRGDLFHFEHLNGVPSGTVVGDIELLFESERKAEFRWRIGADNGSEPFEIVNFTLARENEYPTGLWAGSDQVGLGLSLIQQGVQGAVVAYFYDQQGQPTWALSNGDPSRLLAAEPVEMISFRSTTLCPQCSGEPLFDFTEIGTLQFAFDAAGGLTGTVNADLDLDGELTGSIQLPAMPITGLTVIRPR